MHTTHLPPSKRSVVSFAGVDWEAQKEKLEERREARVTKKKKKRNLGNTAVMLPTPTTDQLRRFLEAASNLDNSEKADELRGMEEAKYLFASPKFKKFAANEKTYMNLTADGADGVAKVKHIADNFDAANKELNNLLVFWLAEATDGGLYVDPPQSPSGGSASTGASAVSDLTPDNGLNAHAEPVMKAVQDLYTEAIRCVYYKGVAQTLEKGQITEAIDEIFNNHRGFSATVVSASTTTFSDAIAYCESLESSNDDDDGDSQDGMKCLHTISSGLSENAIKLQALAINVVTLKMIGWEKSKVDFFYNYSFKNNIGNPGN